MRNRGFSTLDLLVALGIAAILASLAIPRLREASAGLRMRSAALSAERSLMRARIVAIRSGRYTAVKFERAGDRYRFALYQDGNGNGVRSAEIASGVDRPVPGAAEWLRSDVAIGILQGLRIPDPSSPSRPLSNLDDPVRFNRSDLASFSPLGESTPGSIYLTDNHARMAVVRVFGRTAKVRALYFRAGDARWSP
jgi:type II secretory pathway pseudopilin PulG